MRVDYHYFALDEFDYILVWAKENNVKIKEVVKLSIGYRLDYYVNKEKYEKFIRDYR